MIYLDYELERVMRERLGHSLTGYADWRRYTAKVNPDGKTFTVWAHIRDVARKVGEAPLVVKAK